MEQKQTVQAWADFVIERWELEMLRLRITSSGLLLKSFSNTVFTQSNGDVDRILFAFEYYGKFIDMGVGRGVTVANIAQSGRKPKPWYGKIFFSQVKKLSEIMQEKYARQSAIEIANVLENIENTNTGYSSRTR